MAAQDLAEGQRIQEQADRAAVLWRDVAHVAGGLNARAAQHGLDHNWWIAGNMAGIVRCEHARIEVVATPRRETDIKTDGLTAIEVCDGLCLGDLHDQRR